MHKIEIFENGELVTFFFVDISEKDRTECVVRRMMSYANRLSQRNLQYTISKELYDPITKELYVKPKFVSNE